MEKLFLSVLNMSLSASFVIFAVMLARLLLKNAPKNISYALWAVAGFRLVCPLTLESALSLMPIKSAPIPGDIAMQAVPRLESGIAALDTAISAALPAATPIASANPLQVWIGVGTCLWLLGMAVMLSYSLISVLLLKHRLRGATKVAEHLYESEPLKTPFVIGLFQPSIYLPAGLSEEERRYVLLHEETHIRRRDHAVKLLAYLVLCLHWFNPLVWAAFLLMVADMEMSCDERVIKTLGADVKRAYSQTLVRVAAGHPILNGSPLAFGEGSMRGRIKNVLRFKAPSRIVTAAAVALAALVTVGFALNRSDGGAPALLPNSTALYPGTYYLEVPSPLPGTDALTSGLSPSQNGNTDWSTYVALYQDGTALLGSWHLFSSFSGHLLPPLTYSVTGDELLLLANIQSEDEEGIYNMKNGDMVTRFTIADEKTLLLQPSDSLAGTEPGARFVLSLIPQMTVYELVPDDDGAVDDQIATQLRGELPAEADTGWTVLTDVVFVHLHGSESITAVKLYYTEEGIGAQSHLLLNGAYNPRQWGAATINIGFVWRVAESFPNGTQGQIRAVITDGDGAEYESESRNVLYRPPNLDPGIKNQLFAHLSALFTDAYSPYYTDLRYEFSEYRQTTTSSGDYVATFFWSMYWIAGEGYVPQDVGKEMTGNYELRAIGKLGGDGLLDLSTVRVFGSGKTMGEPIYNIPLEEYFPGNRP